MLEADRPSGTVGSGNKAFGLKLSGGKGRESAHKVHIRAIVRTAQS